MKATGIVRRLDDLGRIVIPKEIRRTMKIKEGDPLEIFMDEDGGVVFKKYDAYADLYDVLEEAIEDISEDNPKSEAIKDLRHALQVLRADAQG